jgi:hypothetical protein
VLVRNKLWGAVKYALVALVLTAAVTPGAIVAVAAQSKASPFELVVAGEHEAVPVSLAFPFGIRHRGTFTASSPFCSAGTFFDLTNDLLDSESDTRLYTCADGSGTLTTRQEDWYEHKPPFTDTWRIVKGTGRYADLRGNGSFRGEFLSGNPEDFLTIVFRSTLDGFVAFDAIAPTVNLLAAKVTKLRRPSSTYAIRLTLMMRDNEPGNAVSYTVAVEPGGGGLYLAEKKGSAAPGKVTIALRIRPTTGARTVLLQVGAQDPVGNSGWSTHRLKLPR